MYEWDRVIAAVVRKRERSGAMVGMSHQEMMAIARASAFQAAESWDPEGGRSLSSWVYLQAEYDLLNALRKEGRRFAVQLAEDMPADDDDDLDSVMLVSEALGYLQAHLSSPEFALLWLAHAEGWTMREIAESYGLKVEAVRQRISRARRKSVTILAAHDIEGIGAINV